MSDFRPNRELLVPSGVIDHQIADMCVIVAADVPLQRVQDVLAEQGQWLPIDGDPALSVGELVETNSSGPLRLGYGAWRDLLLGAQFYNGLDELITAGGRTVKNVAGYDLTKFMVGQRGVFGRLATITTRTYKRPAGAILVTFPPSARRIGRLLPSPARPQWALLTREALLCGYLGDERTLSYYESALTEQKPSKIERRTLEADIAHRSALWRGEFRASIPPAKIDDFVAAGKPESWVADVTFGIALCAGGDAKLLESAASALGGTIWSSRSGRAAGPPDTVSTAAQKALLERLKKSFDPESRLAPLPLARDITRMTAALNVITPPALALDPRTYSRALSCVHCGLCLPACPTYTETGHEADSPRGRIQLMRGLADGLIQPTESVKHHLDLCLDCRGCETACPSGVVYHELIEETRARFAETQTPTAQDRFMRWIFFHIFVHPTRLKLALLPARLLQKLGLYQLLRKAGAMKLLPPQLRKMEQMLPPRGALWPSRMAERSRSSGIAKKTVGFFPGCIGSVMFADVNRMAVELLSACGADVIVPRSQGCCGAIHHHNGAHHPAEELAKNNIDTFLPPDGPAVDFIATNIAGCGAMLRDYDFLLRDDPQYKDRAKEFSKRVRDISEVLLELGLPAMKHPIDETITYHDACHLAHAQKVVAQPRQLLSSIPGLKMVALPESDMCCGAAGTYNLQHPEMATSLAARKLSNVATTGATTCATGNVGCAMHIGSEAAARGQAVRIVHPVELLHEAVFGRGSSPVA